MARIQLFTSRTQQALLLLAILGALTGILVLRDSANSGMSFGPSSQTATLLIAFSPDSGSIRRFQGPVASGMTVADALQLAGRAGHFPVLFDAGGQPSELGTVSGTWNIKKNGSTITSPPTREILAPGDTVLVYPANTAR